MTKERLLEFIKKQKTAFISSVDEQGYPLIRAMLSTRKIEVIIFIFQQIHLARKSNNIKRITKLVYIFLNAVNSNIKD